MNGSILDQIHVIRGRPILKEPLNFYNFKQGNRLFLNIVDNESVWKEDLFIGERLFADTVLCVPASNLETNTKELARVQDILKQRMKYPGAREDPAIEAIAKTWVLSTKLHLGPTVEQLLDHSENSARVQLESVLVNLNITDAVIHFMKIELANGLERQVIYKILDNGFRPSLMMVKWGNDLDDHIATAHCAGHILNTGYALVALENGYALYMFIDHSLYDTCSMKTVSVENPFIDSISESILEMVRNSSLTQLKATE